MPYLIILGDNSDLEVDPHDLSRQLCKQWSEVQFKQEMPNAAMLLEWKLKAGKINHVGQLHNDKKTLTIDDYPAGVSEFAVWYRKIIPEKFDVFLYHDSDANLEIRITSETNANEVEKQLESGV